MKCQKYIIFCNTLDDSHPKELFFVVVVIPNRNISNLRLKNFYSSSNSNSLLTNKVRYFKNNQSK